MIWKEKQNGSEPFYHLNCIKNPINFFAKLRRVRFPPRLSLCMHTFHFTGQTAASLVAYQQAEGEHSLLYEVRKGKDSQWNCPELQLTLSCGVHCQFAPAGNLTLFLSLLFQHIQTLSNFMIWCIIVRCMNFPHIVEIILLTINTQQSLLLSEWGNTRTLRPRKKKNNNNKTAHNPKERREHLEEDNKALYATFVQLALCYRNLVRALLIS